jgi:starch phosphorylase
MQFAADGGTPAQIEDAKRFFNPAALTVGFARRFATYKRPNLLLNDPERLVEGVDVWINTPRRPWEACGTSGMKVLVNGGLNLSALDGWWAEAYTPSVGWALGDGGEHEDDPARDASEASQLYDLLETEVVPEFYARDESDIPRRWVARVRESMATLTPVYSANRSVREYLERCYLPAAATNRRRARNDGKLAIEISA